MQLRTLILPSLFFISFTLPGPCSSSKGPPQAKPGDVVYEVNTTLPRFEDMPRQATSRGLFSASDKLVVKAMLSGIVEKVYVGEGDRVKVDDPLCLFRSEELNNQIELKKAEISEAETVLETLRKKMGLGGDTYYRGQGEDEPVFLDEDTEGDTDYYQGEDKYQEKPTYQVQEEPKVKEQKALVERLYKELTLLEEKLKKLNISTSIDGMVQKRLVTEGSVAEKGEALFEIVTLNPITLTFSVPQSVSTYVDKLIKVKVSPAESPEITLQGDIYYISPSINPTNKTLEMRVHIPNEKEQIREGQEGIATVLTRKMDKILVIPKKALVMEKDKHIIYVVTGTQVSKTEVKVLGETKTGEIAIDANIRIDDPIVISGQVNLKDGSFVKIIKETPAMAPLRPIGS